MYIYTYLYICIYIYAYQVKTARELRKELASSSIAPMKLRLYEAYELLMIQHSKTAEQAVGKFTEILNDEKDSVSVCVWVMCLCVRVCVSTHSQRFSITKKTACLCVCVCVCVLMCVLCVT